MSASELLFWIFGLAVCGGAIGVVLSQNIVRMAFWLIISLGSTSGLFFLLNADFVAAVQLLVYVGGTLVLLIFGVMLTSSGPFITMKTSPTEWVAAAVVSSALLGLITVSAFGVDWQEVNRAVGDPAEEGIAKTETDAEGHAKDEEAHGPHKHEAGEQHEGEAETAETETVDDSVVADGESLTEEQKEIAKAKERAIQQGQTIRPLGFALLGLRPDKDLGTEGDPQGVGYLLPFEIVSVHLLVVLIGAAYLARAKRRADAGPVVAE